MIGILGAMDIELEALLSDMENKKEERVSGFSFFTGTLAGRAVVIAKCGIGKVAAEKQGKTKRAQEIAGHKYGNGEGTTLLLCFFQPLGSNLGSGTLCADATAQAGETLHSIQVAAVGANATHTG